MAHFNVCPSCGNNIGEYREYYETAKKVLFENKVFGDSKLSEIDPEKLALSPGSVPDTEIIFTAIELSNYCCRMHLTSSTNFDLTYK